MQMLLAQASLCLLIYKQTREIYWLNRAKSIALQASYDKHLSMLAKVLE